MTQVVYDLVRYDADLFPATLWAGAQPHLDREARSWVEAIDRNGRHLTGPPQPV
ncbi:MAG: hypothetical protein ACLFV0_07755 [Nitriliruptoraceae bacterium]